MRKFRKIVMLLTIMTVVLSALFFINLKKVHAEPNSPQNGTVANVKKINCDGRELNEFIFAGKYSMTESGSGFLVNLSISSDMVDGIKSIANTTSWTKQIIFNVDGVSSVSQKIDGTTGGIISATILLPSAIYNKSYSLSITVSGTHGYIGHGNHGWSMTASTSVIWSKASPTLALKGATNNGYTNRDVTVTSPTADATIEYSHNSSTVTAAASDNFNQIYTAEGKHSFKIYNNDDAVDNSATYTFIIDKSAPVGTLGGVTDKGYTNTDTSFTWVDAPSYQSPITATLNGNSYTKDTVVAAEGKHTIVLTDAAGNSATYTFTIDKSAPTGTLKGVTNGGETAGNVSLSWSEVNVTATLNGNAYNSGATISNSGNHTIVIMDLAGNTSTYTFKIDNTRPYLANLDYIMNIFSLSTSDGNKLSAGQVGYVDIALGRALPGIEFNWADEFSAFNVTLIQSLYHYNIATGEYSIGNATSSAVAGNIKLTKPGEYVLRAKDSLENEVILRFILGASIKFTPDNFVHKTDRYILGNESIANIISFTAGGNLAGASIFFDETNTNLQALTLDNLKSYLADKTEREKSASIKLVSNVNGVECIYFSYKVGYDFFDADIHNIDSLTFEGGSGSYLGTAKPGVKMAFGSLASELEETAVLLQTLYAYDSRNVLYVKEEQTVAYTTGLVISNIGYYVLRISDGAKTTEYTFKVMDEYKSANEFALKSEYFIAPEYNLVKLPMSFGTFNISHHENISDAYLGKYSAEKQYLFSASESTAQAFAFAAEFSVCVQKTATGYLYRAKNQGIQVAYNSIEQLNAKIREVIKEYISYKSMKMTDSQSIDYSNQIIVDESLKYNGNYQNVAAQIVGGVTYDNVLLINKSFVFKTNAGRDALSSLAKITLTNIESGAIYNLPNGTALQDVTTLNGLYKVEENCPGSNTILIYYVYLDNVAPSAGITSTKGDGTVVEQTVTAADTIVLQVAEFSLKSVNDLIDNYCLVYITGYGFSNAIPMRKGELRNIRISTELGHKGAYTIEIYDRSKNKFSFTIYVMGIAPEPTFTKSGSGDTEHVVLNISIPDKYCTVMELSIYRNKSGSNSGELLEDSNNTQISPAVLSYTFKQGGRYTVVIIDNFARTTVIELRYIKDMPNIAVEGLNKERRVNKDITVTLPLNSVYSIVTENNSTIAVDTMTDTSRGIVVLVIRPRNEYNELVYIEDKVTIKAWYDTDADSYNDLSYILDTVAPSISIATESGDILSGALFKQAITIDYDKDVKSISVQRNGKYFSYVKGQVIRLDGEYIVSATDVAGNVALKHVVMDMTVDYSHIYGENKSYLSALEKVSGRAVVLVKSLVLTANEQISVVATKDGYLFDYSMLDKIVVAGLYKFELADNAGNVAVLDYRVLPAVQEISLHAEDGSLLSYNSTTSQSVYLNWNDLSYIKSVSYKQSASLGYSDYIKEDLIIKSGNYTATVTDVLSNTLDIRVCIDKEVSIDIKYDKSYALEEIDGSANTLTKRFSISLNEPNISLSVKRSGEPISYAIGSWSISDGQYEIHASDAAGNVYSAYITVVGESLPNVNITSMGKPIVDKASVKEGFTIAWGDNDYIARVDVNYSRIANATLVTADGKYIIDITDLLDRTRTVTVWIKTRIDYTINYQGSYVITENSIDYFLTRGFSFASTDSLEIAATKNGENFILSKYLTYSTAGDYILNIIDVASNSETINIRVVESAYVPKIKDKSGAELCSGAITNNEFEIVHSEFIAKILVNGQAYNYGDYISVEGKNKIEVIDVIGRNSVMLITIDTIVDCEIIYGKIYEKTAQVLTDRFKINMNEPCTALAQLNGIAFDFKQGISYVTTGLYELTITDSLGNVKYLTIEVDNRTPKINVLDKNSNEITSTTINEEFYLNWDESLNIQEVKVNGSTINNGTSFALAGRYEISITNYLGITTTKVIVVQDSVIYELTTHGNSYEYTSGDNAIILTASFSITGGTSIVKIDGKRNGEETAIVLGKSYNIDGLYEIALTDNAGNSITIYINVSSKAIKGGVEIVGSEWAEDISINTPFSIAGHQFIKEIYVNGVLQALGSSLTAEGVYYIEYVDVLGRKGSQKITIDKTVALTWEYELKKSIEGTDIFLSRRLSLQESERLIYSVRLNDVLIEQFDSATTIKINGMYHIIAKDVLGNELAFYLRVDNLAPLIASGEPNKDNSVIVSIADDIGFSTDVYLDGILEPFNNMNSFLLNKNGKYIIVAVDELGNTSERTITTDMAVSLSYNFLVGQSINFKPTFTANEIISYELYWGDMLVENYRLNDRLPEKGTYRLHATDELDNSLEINFEYHGDSRKQPLMNYKLPNINGLIYKVLFDGQPIEIDALDGVLPLSQTGSYTIIYTIGGREQSHSIDIINTPPKVNLNGYFKSKEDLRTSKPVVIESGANYIIYRNGAALKSGGSLVEKVGTYKVVATDEVGNVSEVEFEIYYSPNAGTVILAIMLALAMMAIVLFILKRKGVLTKKK